MKHYRCVLVQPLDARWALSPGCLNGQSDWTTYRCLWGVLARDEDEAARAAIAQQAECYHLPATVETTEDLGETYNDKPGITWQGVRWCEPSDASAE